MTVRCRAPYEILAIARVGDTTLAVIDTPCYPARYYAGPIRLGEPVDHATHRYFHKLENAVAELERLEREARS